MTTDLLELATYIDPHRARMLIVDFGDSGGRQIAVLLAAAFPPLCPTADWQLRALEGVYEEGWRVRRRADDVGHRLRHAMSAVNDVEARLSQLRRAVWTEKARIALRELLPPARGGASVDVTARELSDLADASIELCLAEAAEYVAQRFGEPLQTNGKPSTLVTLGLGKLGGQELNAGSDVDIMFIYDTDEGESQLSLHDHWTRVARRVVATLEASTPDGRLWRVDLRLRPEGSQGPIVNSMAAVERYYETWGRLWERAALLRSRAVAGDLELGADLEREVVTPFVYRRGVDPRIATALAELVQRSRAELSPAPERDLKLGPGGIREAEFFTQSLQLIWGGREPSLRATGTIQALARLRSRGLVSDNEASNITQAYLLLRRVEHRVQWMTGLQTHSLPTNAFELGRLARSLGWADAESLLYKLDRARKVVRDLFASLAPEAPRPPPRYHALIATLETQAEFVRAAEEAFGSAEVGEHLLTLARRPDDLLGSLTRERFPDLADQVLDAIGESPDAEQAARYLRLFLARFITPMPYVSALADDPHAIRRLLFVLGASAFVGEAIITRPEQADVLVFSGGAVSDPSSALAVELDNSYRSLRADSDTFERRSAFVSALRRAKLRVMVEVAVADLAGAIGTREATRLLSDLADAELREAVNFEMAGKPEGLAVIAVGKLGGRDIGYGSDLDVLFVYDRDASPPGVDAGEYFVRRAQRVIRLISEPHPAGPGYELDTRLRPSGTHGMLVTSLPSFARYHGVALEDYGVETSHPGVMSSGAAWERQALLRARACAGDFGLGERVIRVAEVAAYQRGAPEVAEMHRLRKRMQDELAVEKPGRYDLKTGRGGLLDVEFAVQWLQMTHGHDVHVRTTDTSTALDALAQRGYLSRTHYETLREGYSFLRRLEQRIHILNGQSSTIIDERRRGLTQLARRMGLVDTPEMRARALLLSRYRDVTQAIRAAYLETLGLERE